MLVAILPLLGAPAPLALPDPGEISEVSIKLRLEAGAPVPDARVVLNGTAADGVKRGWQGKTDAEGLVQIPTEAATDRTVRVDLSSLGRQVGIGSPFRELDDGADQYEFILDQCWVRVDPAVLGDWPAAETVFRMTLAEPNSFHATGSGSPCSTVGWGSVFAPAGGTYLVSLERPGKRPLAAVIGSGAAHGVIDLKLEYRPKNLATFRLGVSGAAPARGAEMVASLFPTRPGAGPVCGIQTRVRVGEGGGFGVAFPGDYSVQADVMGGTRHSMVALAAGRATSMARLTAGEDSVVNVHLQPAGGVEILMDEVRLSKTKQSRRLRFSELKVEFRRDVAKGAGAQWRTAELMEITRDGEWRKPRTLTVAKRYALRSSLPEGAYEIRWIALGHPSKPAKVTVKAGEVSSVTLQR